MKALALIVLAGLAGCAGHDVAPTPAPSTSTRIVYVPVKIKDDDLNECIHAQRQQAEETIEWKKYAMKLESLLGIEND